jgi:Holliday junction DNA helicase RuvA
MIGFLRGRLVLKRPPSLVLEVGGVGYELDAPMSTFFALPEVGQELILHTHLAIREDAHSLYGFLTEAEKSLFRTLLKVNGVGARVALGILSGISVEEFVRVVEAQDASRLVRLPGIGKKMAERLIIELRDRLDDFSEVGAIAKPVSGRLDLNAVDEAEAALVALGFRPQDAKSLVQKIDSTDRTSEDLIRLALQSTAR